MLDEVEHVIHFRLERLRVILLERALSVLSLPLDQRQQPRPVPVDELDLVVVHGDGRLDLLGGERLHHGVEGRAADAPRLGEGLLVVVEQRRFALEPADSGRVGHLPCVGV